MDENKKETTEDISVDIEKTTPEPKKIVTKEIAEKEEKIAKNIAKIPVIKDELTIRKEKVISFLKKRKDWAYYLILSFIVFIGMYIRTRNIPKLKDITTGTWTLGPDLDPFLFLRWAKYIVENGSMMVWDMMRYVPLGYNTAGEMKLLSYMIVWLYHFLSFFSKEITVTYAAVVFPVFMAALTAVAFFLFARKIFYKEDKKTRNIIALIATAFFVLIPSLLSRTIAGIPEKESAAFFFMFLAFYFILEAFNSEKLKRGLIFGSLAGLCTAGMALIWGGVIFIFFTIPLSFLLAFLLGKVKKNEFFIYLSWLICSFLLMMPFSTRYAPMNLIVSLSTGLAIGVLFLIGFSLIIGRINKLEKLRKKTKLPKEIFSLIVSILILFLMVTITLGPHLLVEQAVEIKSSLITPISDRFGLTVAENRQPYFAGEWKQSFGPVKFNIPLYFWLFFIGSVVLFNHLIKSLKKKERMILTFSYLVFLICLIFSRYSPSSTLDGISRLSLFVYFGGWAFFIISFGYIYYKKYGDGSFSEFKEFNFSYILYFLVLTLGVIGARGGIRLIMVLGAISPIAVAFLIVKTTKRFSKEKDDSIKLFMGIILIIIFISSIFTLWAYYQTDKITAENFAPGAYQFQWQKAMAWVRDNTSQDAVFAHWWDYGYWLQSIGERATVLDGGNAIVYWNHLMGRLVLTGYQDKETMEYLYTHNATHLLIDSTEIGKYTAYSSIGSDENYDRFSWIATFLMDETQTQETSNQTTYVYGGGFTSDDDIIWEEDGKEIFLPKRKGGIGAIVLERNKNNTLLQPKAIFVYNGNQHRIPLRYAYFDGELHDFESGLEAGIFLFPRLDVLPDGRSNINNLGALMYLSERTIHSNLVNLYLFDQDSEYFKLVHTESNLFVNNVKQQVPDIGELVYYQGLQGPIKIWEINYPKDIEMNNSYLETTFPNEKLNMAKPGEY